MALYEAVGAVDIFRVSKLATNLDLYGCKDPDDVTPLLLAVRIVGDGYWIATAQSRPKLEDRVAVLTALLDELTASGKGRALARLVASQHLRAVSCNGCNVLHEAAKTWQPCHEELEAPARRLIAAATEAGLDINAADAEGATPLHTAAASGSAFLLYLLQAGADIDAKDAEGHTPLELAALHAHPHLARLLCDQGASADSQRLLHLALQRAPAMRSISVDRRGSLVAALLRHPAVDAQATDARGRTLLFHVCGWVNSERDLLPLLRHVLRLAHEHGVPINHQDHEGCTVLHELAQHATPRSSSQFVQILVESGADCSIRNHAGRLPSEVCEGSRHRSDVAAELAKLERQHEAAAAAGSARPAAVASAGKRRRVDAAAASSGDEAEDERPLSQQRTDDEGQEGQGSERRPAARRSPRQQSASPLVRERQSAQEGRQQSQPPEGNTSTAGTTAPAGAADVATTPGQASPASSPPARGQQQPQQGQQQPRGTGAAMASPPAPRAAPVGGGGAHPPAEPAAAAAALVLASPAADAAAEARRRLLAALERCKSAGVLSTGAAGRFRALHNHCLTAEQARQDAHTLSELAAEGELAVAAACVRHAVASASRSPPVAPPSAAQLRQLADLLRPARRAGELPLATAAAYATLFSHSLTPAQRDEDLANFAELDAADVATCASLATRSTGLL